MLCRSWTWFFHQPGIGTSVDAARMSACATMLSGSLPLLPGSFSQYLEVRLPGHLHPAAEVVASRTEERNVKLLVLHEETGTPIAGQNERAPNRSIGLGGAAWEETGAGERVGGIEGVDLLYWT